jgi:hypothetical protein
VNREKATSDKYSAHHKVEYMTLPHDEDTDMMQEIYDISCVHSAQSLGLFTRVNDEPYLTTLGEEIT